MGLYRLRIWAALLNVATAAVFGGILITDAVHFDHDVGKPLPSPPTRLRGLGATAVAVGMILVCVFRVLIR